MISFWNQTSLGLFRWKPNCFILKFDLSPLKYIKIFNTCVLKSDWLSILLNLFMSLTSISKHSYIITLVYFSITILGNLGKSIEGLGDSFANEGANVSILSSIFSHQSAIVLLC